MKTAASFLKNIFLATLVVLSTQVYAAGQETPQKPWIVSQIAAASTSGVNYCSMKTDFSGHYEVVFARDVAGYNSIALDIGKNRFITGAQYPLRLSALSVIREKVFVAVTPRVLITQMGLDEEFFDGLSQAPHLAVAGGAINDNFTMDGAAVALKKLDECANTAALGKKFTVTSVPLTPAPQIQQPDIVAAAPVLPVEQTGIDNESAEQIELLQNQVSELRLQNDKIMTLLKTAQMQPQPQPKPQIQTKTQIAQLPQPRPLVKIKAAVPKPYTAEQDTEDNNRIISATYDLPNDKGRQGLIKMADRYISALSGRCKGDFAFKSRVLQTASKPVAVEVACIGNTQGQDSTAALLFYTKDSQAFVRVNESQPEDAQKLIAERDVFAANLD